MTALVIAWVLTLAASIVIAAIFIVQHLESKYKPYVRHMEAEKRALEGQNRRLTDANRVLRQRYRSLRAQSVEQAKEGTE